MGFLSLTIENVTFANKTIPEKWFGGQYTIYSLTFRHCEFTSIARNAFKETAFLNLKLLKFENVSHFSLESGQFTGIDELSELSFRNTSLSSIDERFMPTIANCLYKFEMISLPRSVVKVNDLLERTKLPLLWSFHLEYALIEDGVLSETNLAALTVVHTLKLIDCEIAAIMVTTFDRLSPLLKILHLHRNRLKSLDERIFDKLILNGITVINLASNPWVCDANVTALAEKLRKKNLPFDISDCKPTEYDENTTTVPPSIVRCANLIQKRKEFSIKYDPGIQNVVIKVFPRASMDLIRLNVLFFSHAIYTKEFEMCNSSSTDKCFGFLTGPDTVIKLPMSTNQMNRMHMVCLLEELNQSTHPLHCISLALIRKPDQNMWIPMSAQVWLLPTLVVIYTLAFAGGLSIAYGAFKMRPRLLRGGPRVVVVRDKKCRDSTVVIMPKEWNNNR